VKLFGPKKTKTTRGPSYYDRENIVHTLRDLNSIYLPKGKLKHNTDKVIMYNDLSLSDITIKKLKNVIGPEDYKLEKVQDLKDYQILFYRHSSEKFNYLMQFHFCENNFLFVNNMIRSSYVLSDEDKQYIMTRFKEKYYPDIEFDFKNGFDLQIIDKTGNFFYTIDSVNFSITYINNSSKFKELITKYNS